VSEKGEGFMDDTKDKIRRNLLIFSSLTIFLLYVNLNETDLIKRVIGDIKFEVQQWKIQLTYIAILLYLLLRYRFTELYTDYLISRRNDIHNLSTAYSNKLVGSALVKIIANQKKKDIFIETEKDFIHFCKTAKEMYPNSTFELRENANDVVPSYEKYYWEGFIHFHINVKYEQGNEQADSKSMKLKFHINKWSRFLISFKVYRNLFLYSKTGVEYILPLVLGWVALIWLVVRFISNAVDCGLSFSNLLPITFSL